MSRAIKIKAPVNSMESAKLEIEAGADEIYLGLFSPEWFSNLSFSHRGKSNLKSDVNGCIKNADDLKEIVSYAHSKDVNVSFTANLMNLTDTNVYEETNKTLVEGYLDYVKMAIDCGVDSIIVATLSEVMHIRDLDKDIKIVASCLFMISNEYYYKMLRSLGVKSFFLPHDTNQIEMKRIIDLANDDEEDIEIGVFCHLSCAMLSGACHWYHKFGEELNLGYPCRNKYFVESEKGKEELTLFDFNCDCSLCQLKDLVQIGISSIKIVGRSSSSRFTSRITSIYAKMLDKILSGSDPIEARKQILENEKWWEDLYCKNNRCKYSNNGKYKQYLIG